ncbi:MAG TPA: hypothetical protein VLH17_17520 [Candidatus Binatia bacterium]|nr:hypothetical protein [Candidatus Binatia bacterium]
MPEKEFGKLTREELHDASKTMRTLRGLKRDIRQAALENPDNYVDLIQRCGYWPFYYDYSLAEVVALYFHFLGLLDFLRNILTSDAPHKNLALACVEDSEIDKAFDRAPEAKQFEAITVVIALFGHLRCMQMYSQPMNRLMARILEGDDDALFDAVMVDRAVLGAKAVSARIAGAQMMDDRSFFDRLAKAITRTRSRRPNPAFDDLRFMIEVIEEAKSLAAFTYEQLGDVLIDDLQLYPDSGADPVSGLTKIIQKRNALYRK